MVVSQKADRSSFCACSVDKVQYAHVLNSSSVRIVALAAHGRGSSNRIQILRLLQTEEKNNDTLLGRKSVIYRRPGVSTSTSKLNMFYFNFTSPFLTLLGFTWPYLNLPGLT